MDSQVKNAHITGAEIVIRCLNEEKVKFVFGLEGEVGMPLFEHLGKKIFLTAAGREMVAFSRTIAQQFTDIRTALEEMQGIQRGHLDIAVTSTGEYFAPYLVAAFSRQHAGITVNLNTTNRETILRQLADNIPDMAIMGSPPTGMPLVVNLSVWGALCRFGFNDFRQIVFNFL